MQQHGDPTLTLAIQDLSPFPPGSYTGTVSAAMVRDLVEFAILGHSERRRYFNETNQEVANKVREAVAAEVQPIVCVDEPYARAQLAAMNEEDLQKLIIGYGPVEAIGINIAQSTEMVRRAIREIQSLAPHTPILYGGSINADNTDDYLNLEGLAGLMVGTASLDVKEFVQICAIAAKA